MTTVVFNGNIDNIQLWHLRLLYYSRSFTNSYLFVLNDSDRRIKQLKGNDRPINTEYERCSLLFALKSVDRVETFDTDQELIDLIKGFEPDVMIKGSDYRGKPIIGAEYCKEIKFYDRLGNYSTTNKIQNIATRG